MEMLGQTISHYRITEKIAEGGMGIVFLADDLRLRRKTALKFLAQNFMKDEKARLRFEKEAQTVASLNHPNIVTLYDLQETEGDYFLVMEYAPGQTLRDLLNRWKENPESASEWDLEQIMQVAAQICDGLNEAHHHGIIHRDLKPENVIITPDGKVKILDLGLAAITGSPDDEQPGSGSLYYMAPEQLVGQETTPHVDIWALGVLLYELLTWERPFEGVHTAGIMYAISNEQQPPLHSRWGDIPPAIVQLIDSCLEKRPVDRPASIESVRQILLDGPEVNRAEAEISGETTKRSHSSTILIASAAVLILLIIMVWKAVEFQSIPDEKRIAVLPFVNLSHTDENQVFNTGLGEYISSELTRWEIPGGSLWVIPFSEVRRLNISSPGEASENLGVNLAISGSVQRTEKQTILTLNLIDANELRQLGSAVIKDNSGNLENLQTNVFKRIANMLAIELQPEKQSAGAKLTTTAPGAYEFYLTGRGYLLDYNKEENLDNAVRQFRKAAENDNQYAPAFAGLGEAYWRKYQLTKDTAWVALAVRNSERAVELDEQMVPGLITLGMIYRGTGRYEEAVEILQDALQIDSQNSQAWQELAGAYSDLGQPEKVEETYRIAIELKPYYWGNYYDLGRFYYRRGKYQKAEEQFLTVISLAPKNYKVFRNLGGIYLLQERYPEARKMLEESIAIQPNYGAYSNLGTLFFIQENYQQAAEMFEKALDQNDRYYRIWGNLGVCYKMLSTDSARTRHAFQKAITLAEAQLRINPKDTRALMGLANYHANLNEFDIAEKYLNQAIEAAPDDLQLQYRGAEIYVLINQVEVALSYLEEVLERGFSLKMVQQSDAFRVLRGDPRYQALLARYAEKSD